MSILLHVCVCTTCMEVHEKVSDILEQGLQTVFAYMWCWVLFQEQPMLLTTEPALLPAVGSFGVGISAF